MVMLEWADLDVWARTVAGEARGYSVDAQIAVAWVVRNRVEADLGHDGKPDWWGEGYKGVCMKSKQFSCWNHNDPNYGVILGLQVTDRSYILALGVCCAVSSDYVPDLTKGATHYHTTCAPGRNVPWPPEWAREMEQTAVVGPHVFYKERR